MGMSGGASRREAFGIVGVGIASAALTATPALAASKASVKPPNKVLSGANAAQGYTIASVSFEVDSYDKYREAIQSIYFTTDPKSKKKSLDQKIFSADEGVIRQIIGKSVDAKGKETAHSLLVFKNEALGPVTRYWDPKSAFSTVFAELKELDVVVNLKTLHTNYHSPTLYRGALPGPPGPLKAGSGVVYAQVALKPEVEAFADWEEGFLSPSTDAFHDAAGVVASAAGPMCPVLIDVSTDAKKFETGVGFVHFTSTGVEASAFGSKLGPILAAQVVRRNGEDRPEASPLAKGGSLYLENFAVTDDFVFASHPPFATKPLKDSEVTVDVPKSVALDGKQKVGKATPQKKVTLD